MVTATAPRRSDITRLFQERINLVPSPSDVCFVVGKMGTGKSTTTRILMSKWCQSHPAIVIDTKPTNIFATWGHVVEDPDEALYWLSRYPRVVYRPPEEYSSPDMLPWHIDIMYQELYERARASKRPVGIVTDETNHVMPGTNPGPGATNVLTRGREHGIMSVWSTQRPARIPLYVYTQATRYYVHRLSGKSDRDAIRHNCGVDEMPPLGRFDFLFISETENVSFTHGFEL